MEKLFLTVRRYNLVSHVNQSSDRSDPPPYGLHDPRWEYRSQSESESDLSASRTRSSYSGSASSVGSETASDSEDSFGSESDSESGSSGSGSYDGQSSTSHYSQGGSSSRQLYGSHNELSR